MASLSHATGCRASLIIPVLNEIATVEAALKRLQCYRRCGFQVIVVDGGSDDGSDRIAQRYSDCCLSVAAGRGRQMNAGAAVAESPWLFFLHIDTQLPTDPAPFLAMLESLRLSPQSGATPWGYCHLRLDGSEWIYRVIAWAINARSRLSGTATGDQLLFCRSDFFGCHGGFSELPLMEDVEICRRWRSVCWPQRLPLTVESSARRWRQQGVVTTVLLMWSLRLAYFFGVNPQRLSRWY